MSHRILIGPTTRSGFRRAVLASCLGALLAVAPALAGGVAFAKGGNGGDNGGGNGGGHGGGAAAGAADTHGAGAHASGSQGRGSQSGASHAFGGQAAHSHDHHGRGLASASQLGALNAIHASATARAHAAPGSRVGVIATYERSMIRAQAMPAATPAQRAIRSAAITQARTQLSATANKPVTASVIRTVDRELGLAPAPYGR